VSIKARLTCCKLFLQIFTPFIVGGGLVIARPGGHMEPDYLAQLIVEHNVSFFNTVPALGLEYYSSPAIKGYKSLRNAIFSGEAMPMELVHLIHRNLAPGVRVVNAYGEWRMSYFVHCYGNEPFSQNLQ